MDGSESNEASSITASLQKVSGKECMPGYDQPTPGYGQFRRANDPPFLTGNKFYNYIINGTITVGGECPPHRTLF